MPVPGQKLVPLQFKLFTIPIPYDGNAAMVEDAMNHFLWRYNIRQVQDQLISNAKGTYWCFLIRYYDEEIALGPVSENKTNS